jgi:hypothetical protein
MPRPTVLASWTLKDGWDGDWARPHARVDLLANPIIDYSRTPVAIVGAADHGLLWYHGMNGGHHLTEPEEALTPSAGDEWLEREWPGLYERVAVERDDDAEDGA